MTAKHHALYFAYGSNLNLDQMQIRCPRAKPLCRADLPGFRLVFKTHADVIPDPRGRVIGAVYEITAECERALDRYEGFPSYYVKRTILTADGREAMFYVMTPRRTLMLPSESYLDCIKRGYQDWGLEPRPLATALRWTERRLEKMELQDIQ